MAGTDHRRGSKLKPDNRLMACTVTWKRATNDTQMTRHDGIPIIEVADVPMRHFGWRDMSEPAQWHQACARSLGASTASTSDAMTGSSLCASDLPCCRFFGHVFTASSEVVRYSPSLTVPMGPGRDVVSSLNDEGASSRDRWFG
jgi:hypothetical protein